MLRNGSIFCIRSCAENIYRLEQVLTIHVATSAFELGKGYSYIQQGEVPLQNSPVNKSVDSAGDMTLSKPDLLLHDRMVEALFIKQI
jgi:hypothetical protein